jgi:sensor histidine kinase regulating citrate/malate metabolism
LAGKTTQAHIDQSLSVGVQTVWLLLALCAAVGVAYAARMRKRMKDCIQQFSPFRKRFELRHDPKRSSADLTDRGDSPSEG